MKGKIKLTILLPTYNEKENVTPLLDEIAKALEQSGYEYEILFIDDSNDETPKIIESQMAKDDRVRMIHRPKEQRTGLATAFIEGFESAEGKYICCLDSDLQHPPSVIPKLLEVAETTGADIVVATRYAKGGSAEGLGSLRTFYGIYRRAVSLGMKYFTQIMFIQTRKTSDPLGGFFLFKKEILQDIKLEPKGFKILVEVLMRTNNSVSVREIPYTFASRTNDDSKATISQGVEFLKHLWFIFKTVPEAGRFLKFCIVGLSGVIVNLGILSFLVEILAFAERPAYIVAVAVSILTNFFFNTIFTYGDKKSPSRRESMRRVLYYYIISMAVMLFNFAIYSLFLSYGLHYIFSAMIGILAATILNFILATKLVWKLKVSV